MPPYVTYPVTVRKPFVCPARSSLCGSSREYVTGMVTRIGARRPRRLYLREHRKDKGISAEQMAGRLGMERESVLRLEREAMTRANPEKQAEYADILQIQPEALWRPPSDPSLDTLVEQAPPEKRELSHDMAANLRRFVSGKS
jgi:transcriptional regulator with XRE-family HTH domain